VDVGLWSGRRGGALTIFFFSIECSDRGFDVALDKSVDNFIVLGRSI
jgi:hypothetical protein